ncbi:F-box/kelch-repeat protein At3g23880-like [Silene latifolia]|uniref:F-box/kelch-repeat protein At3g23880-like n=1 Tax=Silene latifolia TaxID=37657 RepID=UPI003D776ADB
MPSPGETTSCESNNTFMFMPLDLITQVLVRLPVKVVLRFKIVCKCWYSLVSSKEFAKLHQQHAIDNPIHNNPSLQLFMVGRPPKQGKQKSMYTLKIESSEMDKLYKATGSWIYDLANSIDKLKHKFDHPESYPIGSCNGLVCFTVGLGHKMMLCLWNPATDKYHYIKGPHLISQGLVVPLYWGFGYDPLSEDYKILVLGELMPRKPFALLFRLRDTSNTWSRVDCPSDNDMSEFMVNRTHENSKEFRSLPILVGHTLYWKTGDIVVPKKLLAYDLATDSFHIVPLPTLEPAATLDFYICKHRQCLCACWLCIVESSKYIKVWMLDGHGNDKVWKSMFKSRGVERSFYTSLPFPKLFELKEDHKYLLLDSTFKVGLALDSRGEFRHPTKGVMLTSDLLGLGKATRYVFDYTPTLACPSPQLATTIT